jgi:hypothetical protein
VHALDLVLDGIVLCLDLLVELRPTVDRVSKHAGKLTLDVQLQRLHEPTVVSALLLEPVVGRDQEDPRVVEVEANQPKDVDVGVTAEVVEEVDDLEGLAVEVAPLVVEALGGVTDDIVIRLPDNSNQEVEQHDTQEHLHHDERKPDEVNHQLSPELVGIVAPERVVNGHLHVSE